MPPTAKPPTAKKPSSVPFAESAPNSACPLCLPTIEVVEVTILDIKFADEIHVARNKKNVISTAAPVHWRKSDAATFVEEDDKPLQHFTTGSKSPAAYVMAKNGVPKKGADYTFKVNIAVTNKSAASTASLLLPSYLDDWLAPILGNPPKPSFILVAKFPNGLIAYSTMNIPATTIASRPVTMKFLEGTLPKTLTHLECEPEWIARMHLPVPRLPQDIPQKHNHTKVELFFLYDTPAEFYGEEGVWAEALRLCFKGAKVGRLSDPKAISAKITKYCHTNHGMRYDTKGGRSCFGVSGAGEGEFMLKGYIERKSTMAPKFAPNPMPENTVNCYDSAAAVQALSGALGVRTQWIFQSPFGFMAKTDLVGIGECNNPFFEGNGTSKVVDPQNRYRTGFGNHAFIAGTPRKSDLRDACAGPHVGNETLRQYLESAIDKEALIDDAWYASKGLKGGTKKEKEKAMKEALKEDYDLAERYGSYFYEGIRAITWE